MATGAIASTFKLTVWLTGLIVSAIVVTGCSEYSDSTNRPRRVPAYDPAQFEYPPHKGDLAKFSNLGRFEIANAAFRKRYNRKDLEAVLSASGFSTIDYMRRLKIEMYRVPRPDDYNDPIYFVPLTEPPSTFDHLWRHNASRPTEKGVLAGLYFDACPLSDNCSPTQVVRPVILVDESGDRWTLVHELLHFLFNARRKVEQRPESSDIEGPVDLAIRNAQSRRSEHEATRTEDSLLEFLSSYDQVASLTYQRSVIRELEEVAVEHLLLQEFSSGRFENVSPRSARSAVWYMNLKANEALELLAPLEAHVKVLKAEARAQGWARASARANQTLEFIDGFRSESKSLLYEGSRMARNSSLRNRSNDDDVNLLAAHLVEPSVLEPVRKPDCLHQNGDSRKLKEAIQNLTQF